jgi:phosphatidylglycerol:prolipoprotein diacylglycerol transferase
LGQAIGRLGCFAAGDSSGKPTDWPWGVYFTELAHTNTGVSINATDGSNLYLYPTQLYESFTMFAVFRLLVYLHRHKRLDGYVLIVRTHLPGSTLYIEFLRDDLRGDLLGLTTVTGLSTSQLVSLLVVLGVLTFMILHPLKLGQL